MGFDQADAIRIIVARAAGALPEDQLTQWLRERLLP